METNQTGEAITKSNDGKPTIWMQGTAEEDDEGVQAGPVP